MSVNISTNKLQCRVGRPLPLSSTVHSNCFPHLNCEIGYRYFTVSKIQVDASEKEEIHCLRVKDNEPFDFVNEMHWYCLNCDKFPCQWRVRQRHLKTCSLRPPKPSNQLQSHSPQSSYASSSSSRSQSQPNLQKNEVSINVYANQQITVNNGQFQQLNHDNNKQNSPNHYNQSSPPNHIQNTIINNNIHINNLNNNPNNYYNNNNYQEPASPTSQWIDELLYEFSSLELNTNKLSEIEQSLMSLCIDSEEFNQLQYHYDNQNQNQNQYF